MPYRMLPTKDIVSPSLHPAKWTRMSVLCTWQNAAPIQPDDIEAVDTAAVVSPSFLEAPSPLPPPSSSLPNEMVFTADLSLPGTPDKIQGRLSQKSSLIMSTCSIAMAALVRRLRSLSAADLDNGAGGFLCSMLPLVTFLWALLLLLMLFPTSLSVHGSNCTTHTHIYIYTLR